MYEKICEILHQEMKQIEQKLSDGKNRMTNQDLEDINRIAHALKSLATYEAMKGGSEYGGESYARGRSPMTGRYISRDGGSYYSPREGADPYWDRR